jgi:hypothetical protein
VETLRFTTGTPLARIGENDAIVVRQVGKGWAIYLNAGLDTAAHTAGLRRREPAP